MVAEGSNLSSERRRELSVDEKAQSCAPQDGMIVLSRGELQDRRDVFRFQVWVVREDLLVRRTGGEKVQHVFHTDAQTTDAGPAAADVPRHGDAIHRTHVCSRAARLRHANKGNTSMNFDPRDYDSRDDDRHTAGPAVKAAIALMNAIVSTTGARLDCTDTTDMSTTRGRSVGVQGTSGKALKTAVATAPRIRAGTHATATPASEIESPRPIHAASPLAAWARAKAGS